jgi:ribosome-binding protein aMBF1 (putative translation factor)
MESQKKSVIVGLREKQKMDETARVIEDLDRTIKEMREMMGIIRKILGDIEGNCRSTDLLENKEIYPYWEDIIQGS